MTTPDANGWLPIETAPKDWTTDVDLFANGERYADCFWGKPTYAPGPDWVRFAYDDTNGPVFNVVHGPSHWRPIPKPPVSP